MPARVEWIRDRLERVTFSRVEVLNKWRKAKAKADDAAQNVSADTALGAAYDAGRIACEAVLACHHVPRWTPQIRPLIDTSKPATTMTG
ncbi:MAG: hypothetical protein ACK54K_15430 [Gemmatimonadaceae bacterium]